MKKLLYFLIPGFCFVLLTLNTTVLYATIYTPHFTLGHSHTINSCEFSNPNPIDTLLRVNDTAVGVTITWSLISGAFHGVATGGYGATSTGGVVTPSGLFYTPGTAYIGNDTFSIRVTDGTYSDTITIYVTVLPLPHVGAITGHDTLCTGQTVSLTDTPSGTWSSINTRASVSATGIVTGIAAGIDTIFYSVSNFCGLIQAERPIVIYASPNAGTISGPDTMCAGTIITLIETSSAGVWSTSNVLDTVIFGLVRGNVVGFDTISYTATNAHCTSVVRHTIAILPIPRVSVINGPLIICQGTSYTMSDSIAGGVWSCQNGNAAINALGIITGVSAGPDIVYYNFTNTCGAAIAEIAITVDPLPAVTPIYGASAICLGSSLILTDTTIGGIWSSGNNAIATVSGGVVASVSGGIDTIKYAITNGCGTTTAVYAITVNLVPITLSILGPTGICVGVTDTFADSSTGGVWRLSNSNATNVSNRITGNLVGTDTIYYAIFNMCGADSVMAVITMNPQPAAGEISGITSICPKDTVFIYDTTLGGTWSSSDSVIASISPTTGDSARITGIASGTVTFSYAITNSCGTAYAFFPVTVGYSSICPNLVKQVIAPASELIVFPNPNSGSFTVSLSLTTGLQLPTHFIIANIFGENVIEFDNISGVEVDIHFNGPPDIYFLSAINDYGKLERKIIVSK